MSLVAVEQQQDDFRGDAGSAGAAARKVAEPQKLRGRGAPLRNGYLRVRRGGPSHARPFHRKPFPHPASSAYITLASAAAPHHSLLPLPLEASFDSLKVRGNGVAEGWSRCLAGRADSGRGCAARRRRGGGGQVRRRGAAELGQRPHGVRRRPAHAPPRLQLRRRLRLQEQVPVREGQRGPEAGAGRFRRRCHRFLSVVGGGHPQRVRLRVPGQRHRRTVPGADEPVHRGRGQPRAAHRPVVRPHRRLPHLRRALEPQPGRLHGRRHPDPRLREQERHQRPPPPRRQRHQQHHPAVPVAAADGGVQLHLERGRLGDAGRPREDGLVARAVRGHVPGGARGRLRLGAQRHRLGRRRGEEVHRELVRQGGALLVEGEGDGGADRAPEPPARLGARAPPRLRLLRRHRPLPRPAARVRRPLIVDDRLYHVHC